jgi:hypothetical protein
MKNPSVRIAWAVVVVLSAGLVALHGQAPALPRSDANGNPIRLATKTGHISNYDEKKVPPYTLPDPLVFADGTPVRVARDWTTKRRAELIRLYETQIFGRIPASTPRVSWVVKEDHGPR